MARLVGRRPVETKVSALDSGSIPIYNSDLKSWDTINISDVTSSVFPYTGSAIISGSLVVSGSTNIVGTTGTTLLSTNADTLIFTGSLYTSGSIISTGSLEVKGGITGSLLGTSSFADTASRAISSSYAETASYANNFTVAGTLTAQTIVAQTITSSTEFITGSTKFGSELSNTHQFTGSVGITGSLEVNGRNYINDSSSFESRITTNSASFATFSGSYINESSSFANRVTTNSASFATFSGSYINESSSFANRITTNSASFATFSGSYINESSSFASRISTNSASFATFSGSYINESSSFASRITTNSASFASFSGSYINESSSFANRITTNSASFASFSGSYINESSSFASRITTNSASISSLSSSFLSFSSSYNSASFTGSFKGDGGGLYNIPAGGIVGLNLSQIASGSVTASISPNKGFVINTNTEITGTLIVTDKITGLLLGTASYASQSLSSSYAETASNAPNYLPLAGGTMTGDIYAAGRTFTFQDLLLGAGTTFGKITTDGTKYISIMPTYNVESARFWPNGNVTIQDAGTYVDNGFRLDVSGSGRFTDRLTVTGSLQVTSGITGSLLGTSSYAMQALSASYALQAVSASYTATASSADDFTVRGTLTAQTIVAQTITSSTEFITGSTKFGSLLSNTHQFTGSVSITGSLTMVNSNITIPYDNTAFIIGNNNDVGIVKKLGAGGFFAFGNANDFVISQASASGNVFPSNTFIQKLSINSSTGVLTNSNGITAGSAGADNFGIEVLNELAMVKKSGGGAFIAYPANRDFFIAQSTANSVTATNTFNRRLTIDQTSGHVLINTTVNNGFRTAIYGTGSPSGSLFVSGTSLFSGSVTSTLGFTGSLLGTASYALQALTASNANTASSADNFVVRGTLTAQTIIAQTITSSVEYITGSTQFGSLLSNTHQFTGSVEITGSLSINGRSYTNDSSSFASRITNNSASFALFSGSYINESASFASRITSDSSSFASRITTNSASFATFSGSYINESSSFASRITTNSASISTLSASFNAFSGSYNTASFTGSFKGDGAGLYNIPASGITGLNLSRIASGSVTASVSPVDGFRVNTNTEITGSLIVTDVIKGTGSIHLQPDLNDSRDFRIYNTAPSDIHIKGNAAYSFFGDDVNYLKIDTNSQTITIEAINGVTITSSLSADSVTGSLQGTASYASNANLLDGKDSSVFASTGSNSFSGSQTISSGFKLFTDAVENLTGNTLNLFGDVKFNGNIVDVPNDLAVTGSLNAPSITGSLQGTASYATNALSASRSTNANTASYVLNAVSSSYSNFALSSSYSNNSTSASFAQNALSASYAPPIDTSYFATTGSNTFIGNQTITGSLLVSGSISTTGNVNITTGNALVTHHIKAEGSNGLEIFANNGALIASMGQGGGTQANFTGSLSSTQFSAPSITGSLLGTASYAQNANLLDGKDSTIFATTGSNIFVGNQTISGSLVVSGSTTILQNLTVLGTASYNTVTASSLLVNDNWITVTTTSSLGRFGGIRVLDYESTGDTASFAWDTTADRWVEIAPQHDTYSSSLFIMGPKNTGSLGSEIGLTPNFIPRSEDEHHLINSAISDNGTNIILGRNSIITGSLNITQGVTASLLGTASYAVQALSASYWSGSIKHAETSSYSFYAESVGGIISGSIVTTGSNNFVGNQTISGSLSVTGNLTVLGTASFTYVTASQIALSASFLSLNVFEPAERFGGIKVYDSGSLAHQATASLAWDSLRNVWVYQNVTGSSTTGGVLIAGPENTGSLGNEAFLIDGRIVKSVGENHIDNSIMSEISGSIGVSGSLVVTGSFGLLQSIYKNQNTSSLTSGTKIISTNSTSSYTSAFYNYVLSSGANARAGQFITVWNGSSINYTDVSTTDIGNTLSVVFTASLSGGNVVLSTVLPSNDWTIKTNVNLL